MEAKQHDTNQPTAGQAEAGQVLEQSEQSAGQSVPPQAPGLSGKQEPTPGWMEDKNIHEVPKGTCSEGQPLNTDQAVHSPGKQECSNRSAGSKRASSCSALKTSNSRGIRSQQSPRALSPWDELVKKGISCMRCASKSHDTKDCRTSRFDLYCDHCRSHGHIDEVCTKNFSRS